MGGTDWEIRIDIYTLLCVKKIASRNLLCKTGRPARCCVMTSRGGMREVQERWTDVYFIIQQKHGKDPDTGRDWGQEEKGTTEDEMVGWHHRLDGHGSE